MHISPRPGESNRSAPFARRTGVAASGPCNTCPTGTLSVFFLCGSVPAGCYRWNMTPDCELLRRYAETRSESAYAELVQRHLNLVYSAALRQVNGNAHLAQD